jgi:5-methylcytosine-specific restriction protein A
VIAVWEDIVRREIEACTGAAIGLSAKKDDRRTALRIWFADLDEKHGPVVELKPHGLNRYRAILEFGQSAGAVIRQMQRASHEDVQLARALVGSIGGDVDLDFGGQTKDGWKVPDRGFCITATARKASDASDEAVARISREVVVPLMAAMAELIGYDVIEEDGTEDYAVEGAILVSTIVRRERNPRNRLLCIRLHGERCACCGFEPRTLYGDAGGIIEVHHLEALSLLETPRPYDPAIDLAPLCPNCHRAVHTRRPFPLGIDELRVLMRCQPRGREQA